MFRDAGVEGDLWGEGGGSRNGKREWRLVGIKLKIRFAEILFYERFD